MSRTCSSVSSSPSAVEESRISRLPTWPVVVEDSTLRNCASRALSWRMRLLRAGGLRRDLPAAPSTYLALAGREPLDGQLAHDDRAPHVQDRSTLRHRREV